MKPVKSPVAIPTTTGRRWMILAFLMALCFISHFNRASITSAGDERIMQQFGISPERMGVIYSSFLVVYTVFMIPGGWLIDHRGPRFALVGMGLGSALFCVFTGLIGFQILAADKVWMALLVVRSLMGLLSAPLHPGAARAAGNWFPPGRQSLANGLITGASILAYAVVHPVFGGLIDRFDWPVAFVLTGSATALLALGWLAFATDRPADTTPLPPTPATSLAVEQESRKVLTTDDTDNADGPDRLSSPIRAVRDIRGSPSGSAATESGGESEVASSPAGSAGLAPHGLRNLCLLTLSYSAVGYFQYLFFYWLHYYFDSVLHMAPADSRTFAGLPSLAMAVCMPLGGWLTDRAVRVWGMGTGATLVPRVGMILSALLLGCGIFATDRTWIVACFTASLGLLGLCEASFWTVAIQLGRRRGGTSAAIMNTGGNGIGLLAPMITPWIGTHLGWNWGLGVGAVIGALGALCWLGIKLKDEPIRAET